MPKKLLAMLFAGILFFAACGDDDDVDSDVDVDQTIVESDDDDMDDEDMDDEDMDDEDMDDEDDSES